LIFACAVERKREPPKHRQVGVQSHSLDAADPEEREAVVVFQPTKLPLDGGAAAVEVAPLVRATRDAGQLTRATRDKPAKIIARKGGAAPYQAVLFPALERTLIDHLRAEQASGRGRDSDHVLATRTGRPLSQRNVARALADAATSAGLGKVTPHTLRRSFCSLAARRGVDPVQASKMTGHSLDTWTRHYAGDYGKPQRDEARDRMLAHGFGAVEDAAADTDAEVR
jgi:Phage integrase family